MKFKAKRAFVKSRLPKANYVLNPYVGCKWGCRYCYSKQIFSRFFGIKEEWGKYVFEKEGILPTVEREKERMRGKYVLLSSTVDPYQPLEGKRRVVRRILEMSLNSGIRWSILTKSPLVLRDVDLFRKLNVEVGMSVGFFSQEVKKLLEPYAPPHEKRIEALMELAKNKINIYLMISPYISNISNIEWIMSSIKLLKDLTNETFYVMIEPLNVQYLGREYVNVLLQLGMDKRHLTKVGRQEIVNEVGKQISREVSNLKIELYSH